MCDNAVTREVGYDWGAMNEISELCQTNNLNMTPCLNNRARVSRDLSCTWRHQLHNFYVYATPALESNHNAS